MLKSRKSPGKKELNKTTSQASLRLLKKNKSNDNLFKRDNKDKVKDTIKEKEKNYYKDKDKDTDNERDALEQSKLKKRIESMQAP